MQADAMWIGIDDRSVLRRFARRGDAEAFAVLTRRYRGMVMATCLRTLGNASDAEDATQETFIKLSQQAAGIRSGVAAWLHACAMGTSVDLLRRGAARRRTEARAAAKSDASDATEREDARCLWREIEGAVDAALSELDERDRDLIVAVFLADRSQADLARASGVSRGTLSRRLSRALQRLRERLSDRGFAIGGVGLLAASLAHATPGEVGDALATSLGKIALAGVSRGAAGGRAALMCVVGGVALAGAITVGAVGVSTSGVASGLGSAAVSMSDDEIGPPRPERRIGPFEVVTASDLSFAERGVWLGDRSLTFRYGYLPDTGEARSASLVVRNVRAVDDDADTTDVVEHARIEARVRSITPVGDEWSRFKIGERLSIACGFDDLGRLVLREVDGKVQLGRNEPTYYGVRPPMGWPEFGRIPANAGEHGIDGPWTEAERIPVTITGEEIAFGTDKWSAGRYRVIEWERRSGHSRVLAVNAGGRDPRLIGTRFRLLIRKDDAGYTIAYFPPGSGLTDRWPSSFEPSRANPVRVVSFTETD